MSFRLISLFLVALGVSLSSSTEATSTTLGGNAATISRSEITLMQSETLPGNLLPSFMFQQGSIEGGSVGVKLGGGRGTPKPFAPDDSCGDDIFEGAMTDMRSPQLPYLTQDQWTCDRTPDTPLPVITLSDAYLKVTVTPQYAGKVYSIYDKKNAREQLYANRAHQPANIGALKSWAAGGAEWNWSPGIIGHSAFSETQVHVGTLQTERGPLLRVFEYDRYNSTVWQVDMMLDGNGSFLAHPKITNPTAADLRGYWWTCVAVPATPSTRILTPATHVAETSRDPMRQAPWPVFAEALENASFTGYQNGIGSDNSYLGNHQIGDMFLRIPSPADDEKIYTPYIAHTESDGYVLVHGHPLNGTKFYTWGQSGPGRFMQDFLAGGGKRQGDYTELQVGPAPTQMQNFAVPPNSQRQWTEWFKAFQATSPASVHAAPYADALKVVDEWMRTSDGSGMTQEHVADWDAFFEKHSTAPIQELLVQGTPWGALEEELRRRTGSSRNDDGKLAPGLLFTLPEDPESALGQEVAPWLELLEQGTFSPATLAKYPTSYQTTDAWLALLQASADKFGLSWLHALHIGIALTERGEITRPRELFQHSFAQRPNAIAARCLGVLSQNAQEAWPFFKQAWAVAQQESENSIYKRLTTNLVTEMSYFLQQAFASDAATWGDEMSAFIDAVPEAFRGIDSYITMTLKMYLAQGHFDLAVQVLGKECFPTYAKARDDLMNMWNLAQEGLAQQAKGSGAAPITALEKHQARVAHPIPDNIGCQYASEYCTNYW